MMGFEPPVLLSHDLARQLLELPDLEVIVVTSCCGCHAPKYTDQPLTVILNSDRIMIGDEPGAAS